MGCRGKCLRSLLFCDTPFEIRVCSAQYICLSWFGTSLDFSLENLRPPSAESRDYEEFSHRCIAIVPGRGSETGETLNQEQVNPLQTIAEAGLGAYVRGVYVYVYIHICRSFRGILVVSHCFISQLSKKTFLKSCPKSSWQMCSWGGVFPITFS